MSLQTRKTLVNLHNTNEDIFDEIRELSDSSATDTFKAQKVVRTLLKNLCEISG